jgi:hypothetical protein
MTVPSQHSSFQHSGKFQMWFEAQMALRRLMTVALPLLSLLILTPFAAVAQNQAAAPAAPLSEQLLKPEELDALVAPVALYPDNLAVAPAPHRQASWSNQSWCSSLREHLTWQLANKKLTSTKEQKVTKTQEQGKQVIVIEPTDPDTIYVPYYDPAVAYGGWPYPDYQPYYFGWPGYIPGALIATGIGFGAGYALGRWASGGNYWGGGCNWGQQQHQYKSAKG